MKQITITLIALLTITSYHVQGQKISIHKNEPIADSIIYLFTQFEQGRAVFEPNRHFVGKFNYNIFSHQIQFIDSDGARMEINDTSNLLFVNCNGRTFIFHKGQFYQTSGTRGETEIVTLPRWQMVDIKREGAFGITTSTHGGIEDISSRDLLYGKDNQYLSKDELVLERRTSYFIRRGDDLRSADKRNFLKLFPRKKAAIEKYIASVNPDFESGDDLEALLLFCLEHQ